MKQYIFSHKQVPAMSMLQQQQNRLVPFLGKSNAVKDELNQNNHSDQQAQNSMDDFDSDHSGEEQNQNLLNKARISHFGTYQSNSAPMALPQNQIDQIVSAIQTVPVSVPWPFSLRKNRDQNSAFVELNKQATKYEQQRLVAKLFCESGMNYSLLQYFYPSMSPQKYRCHLLTINNQAINELIKYLVYECQVKTDRLNKDEKRALRTQLLKVRDWLGSRDKLQLQTYYRLIERHYEKNNAQLNYKDALRLYRTFIEVIRGPLEDAFAVNRNQKFRVASGNVSEDEDLEQSPLSQGQQREIFQAYARQKSLAALFRDNKLLAKWPKSLIRNTLRHLLQQAIRRLHLSVAKYSSQQRIPYIECQISPTIDNTRTLLEAETTFELKMQLMEFYFKHKVSCSQIVVLVQKINSYVRGQRRQPQSDLDDHFQVPKLETKDEYDADDQVVEIGCLKTKRQGFLKIKMGESIQDTRVPTINLDQDDDCTAVELSSDDDDIVDITHHNHSETNRHSHNLTSLETKQLVPTVSICIDINQNMSKGGQSIVQIPNRQINIQEATFINKPQQAQRNLRVQQNSNQKGLQSEQRRITNIQPILISNGNQQAVIQNDNNLQQEKQQFDINSAIIKLQSQIRSIIETIPPNQNNSQSSQAAQLITGSAEPIKSHKQFNNIIYKVHSHSKANQESNLMELQLPSQLIQGDRKGISIAQKINHNIGSINPIQLKPLNTQNKSIIAVFGENEANQHIEALIQSQFSSLQSQKVNKNFILNPITHQKVQATQNGQSQIIQTVKIAQNCQFQRRNNNKQTSNFNQNIKEYQQSQNIEQFNINKQFSNNNVAQISELALPIENNRDSQLFENNLNYNGTKKQFELVKNSIKQQEMESEPSNSQHLPNTAPYDPFQELCDQRNLHQIKLQQSEFQAANNIERQFYQTIKAKFSRLLCKQSLNRKEQND